jgi:epsilon-lactone hydrolase
VAAWHFLRELGIAAEHIAVGGDSTGGGLTVVLINRLRDDHEQLPACAWLVSPWTDMTTARASSVSGTVRPSAFTALGLITNSYLVGACTGRSAGFSPMRIRST